MTELLEWYAFRTVLYISPNDYTVQTQSKCSILKFATPSPVSFTVRYVGRRPIKFHGLHSVIVKENKIKVDGVTSRNNQLQLITQMWYHDTTKKIIVLAK